MTSHETTSIGREVGEDAGSNRSSSSSGYVSVAAAGKRAATVTPTASTMEESPRNGATEEEQWTVAEEPVVEGQPRLVRLVSEYPEEGLGISITVCIILNLFQI
jgi:hypothetical protein